VSAPRIAVFDLGGVVVRICRTWEEGCRAAGIAPRALRAPAEAAPEIDALVRAHQRGEHAAGHHYERLAAIVGGHSADEVGRIHASWILGDYPGMAAAIDRIHAAGADTACLSNTNAAHWEQLAGSEAFRRIRRPFASHLMGLVKPDAAIYRAFERAAGAVPGDIVFFDDLAENVDAARACGWDAVLVDHGGDTAAQVLAALRARGVPA
jgi:epoxide hydrolase-like predicted phosphatase